MQTEIEDNVSLNEHYRQAGVNQHACRGRDIRRRDINDGEPEEMG